LVALVACSWPTPDAGPAAASGAEAAALATLDAAPLTANPLGALAALDCELAPLEQPASAATVAIVMSANPGAATASRLRPGACLRAWRPWRAVRRESLFSMSL